MSAEGNHQAAGHGLRRELGGLESYAILVGTLVGAGIFRVTSEAYGATGPSVLLGYFVLAPLTLATSIAYAAFLSTSLGRIPGGEYAHIARTFGAKGLAFVGAWLKIVAYLGAGAYLADTMAAYLLQLGDLAGWELDPTSWQKPLAVLTLLAFFGLHCSGVRWIGRAQVWMCTVLALAVAVLVIPGLFAVEVANFEPFFTGGADGFVSALVPMFFAYAGFESLAHAAGEVKDSSERLPGVFLRGLVFSTLIFVAMSVVAFGVRPAGGLADSSAPMADVAAVYLPGGAAAVVTLGALMAIATSINGSVLVPARIAMMLAHDGLLPKAFAHVHAGSGTPRVGITVATLLSLALLLSDQIGVALGIAVFALFLLYALHSFAMVRLPACNPELAAEINPRLRPGLRAIAGLVSILSMGALVVVQVLGDAESIAASSFAERWDQGTLTTVELAGFWALLGVAFYLLRARRAAAGQSTA